EASKHCTILQKDPNDITNNSKMPSSPCLTLIKNNSDPLDTSTDTLSPPTCQTQTPPRLPPELMGIILSLLHPSTVFKLKLVCHDFHSIISSISFAAANWRNLTQPPLLALPVATSHITSNLTTHSESLYASKWDHLWFKSPASHQTVYATTHLAHMTTIQWGMSPENYHVIMELNTPLPLAICLLSQLVCLNLSDCCLVGTIPAQIGDMKSLQVLDLSFNQLCGEIPVSIGKLANLKRLALGNNALSGSIPTELCGLSKLEYLDVSNNADLCEELPEEFMGKMPQLTHLGVGST
ncbi:hypothetical protein HDU98_003055, partial [Podochytrium sp. JEL0797]